MNQFFMRGSVIAFAAFVALSVLAAGGPALAADPVDSNAFAPAGAVSDAELATLRGRFAPSRPATAAALPAQNVVVNDVARTALGQPSVIVAGSALGLAGSQVNGFGLEMATSWQSASGTQYSAGVDLGVSFADPSRPSIATWSLTTTVDASKTVASVNNASALGVGISGVSQVVQIAGNGNDAFNHAVIGIGGTLPGGPSTGGACSSCTVSIGGNAMTVSVGPNIGDAAAQSVGASGIAQGISIASNGNAVNNALQLQLRTSPIPVGIGGFNAQSTLSMLQLTRLP